MLYLLKTVQNENDLEAIVEIGKTGTCQSQSGHDSTFQFALSDVSREEGNSRHKILQLSIFVVPLLKCRNCHNHSGQPGEDSLMHKSVTHKVKI